MATFVQRGMMKLMLQVSAYFNAYIYLLCCNSRWRTIIIVQSGAGWKSRDI
jgi:hypothetical protein